MKKCLIFMDLIRINHPTGFLLLFFPCAFGILLSSKASHDLIIYLTTFLFGSIMMRGAGCIINDILDKDIDPLVERTKNRPIASGSISVKESVVFLLILLFLSSPILFLLSKKSIIVLLFSLILVCIYPLMKRYTSFPQLFLGVTFNIGALIGYLSLEQTVSYEILVLYCGCIFWTLGYDTIYGFMDIKDDIRIDVKSLSILLQRSYPRILIGLFYCIFYISFLVASGAKSSNISHMSIACKICALALLLWQAMTLDVSISKNCLSRFKSNMYVGLFLALSLL